MNRNRSISMSTEIFAKLEKLAAIENKSFNAYVTKILTDHIHRDSDLVYELMSCIRTLSEKIEKVERNQNLLQSRFRGQPAWLMPFLISYSAERASKRHGSLTDEDVTTIVSGYEKEIALFSSYLKKKDVKYKSEIESEFTDSVIEDEK